MVQQLRGQEVCVLIDKRAGGRLVRIMLNGKQVRGGCRVCAHAKISKEQVTAAAAATQLCDWFP